MQKTIFVSTLPKKGRWSQGISSYDDNPAMLSGYTPNSERLLSELNGLIEGLQKVPDAAVEKLQFPDGTNLDDFVFVRDSFLSNQKDTIILSNFHEKSRHDEVRYIEDQLCKYIQNKKLAYKIIKAPSGDMYIEGGEFRYLPKQNLLLVGQSRNTDEGIQFVKQQFGIPNENCIILHGQGFHLDVYCSVVTDMVDNLKYIIVCEELVSEEELQKLEEFGNKHGALLLRIPAEYGIGKDGKGSLATNTLQIKDYLIGCDAFPPSIETTLETHGIKRIIINVSEYTKSGGAIHCLTNII